MGIISLVLLGLLGILAIAITVTYSYISIVVLTSMMSLIFVLLLIMVNSVDVALTEASIGAYTSTLFLLLSLPKITCLKSKSKPHRLTTAVYLTIVILIAIKVTPYINYITISAGNSPENHLSVYGYYVANSYSNFGIKNMVSAILAGFRGYDTLIETFVIFTAGIGVSFLLCRDE